MKETVQQLLDRLQVNEIIVEERAMGPHDEDACLGAYKYSFGTIIADEDNFSTDEIVDFYYFEDSHIVIYIVTEWMYEEGLV